MPKTSRKPEDFIVPLNINGLEGRMLRLPSKKKKGRNILFIYGQHSSIERWFGLACELNKLGEVTMPDLPGLGGMTSLYKIGREGNIDNMAEYLATFIKLKFRGKKITIVGMSLGFVIVTRMLQKYPELTKKVDVLVSIVGFAHSSDFTFTRTRITLYDIISRMFVGKYSSKLFRRTALSPVMLNLAYHRTHNAKEKFEGFSREQFKKTMKMEVKLWHDNDIRTQFRNYIEMFHLDNTHSRVNLPVYHVAAKKDRYFNNIKVEQHMRMIFSDFTIFYTKAPNHAPTVIATAKDAAPFMPSDLKKLLRQT